MPVTRVLIVVKTYPTLSNKYDELVCTAGFKEDGTWIRIYPIPFRKLEYDQQFNKYDWIEVNLEKNRKDFRKESFKPVSLDTQFVRTGHLDTRDNWKLRKEIVLKHIHTDLSTLIDEARDKTKCTSLAVFKPREILDFTIEADAAEWDPKRLAALDVRARQTNLFANSDNPFKVVRKLPFKFSYVFTDSNNRQAKLMIEDWEIGALFWKSLKRHNGDHAKACADVRLKYFNDFAQKKDLYLYLGTTREYHFVGTNPFLIIGTFHPAPVIQGSLF